MSMSRRGGGRVRVSVGEALRRTGGEDARALLLDVRADHEWSAGHAPGAVHVPLSRLLAGTVPRATAPHPVADARGNIEVRGSGGLRADGGVDARGNSGQTI
ncbi:rhodanese-like domain-containing protein [Streptomyces olivaceoviridis]|uniref:rhodanese-like domain-containing protein n=1 Tax=Streptomyces olivaceoviridis TaxID=1921 RepID=UPI0033BAA4E3